MDTGDVEAMQAMSRKNVRARRVSFQDRGNDPTNLEHQPEERSQLPNYDEGWQKRLISLVLMSVSHHHYPSLC